LPRGGSVAYNFLPIIKALGDLDVMRKFLTLVLLGSSFKVTAISPLPVQELTPDKAEELGFESSFQSSKLETVFSLTAPKQLNGCEFKTSSMDLTDDKGQSLGLVMTEVSITNDKPNLTVFLTNSSVNYRVAAHYICSDGSNGRGKIYLIKSVREYMADSLKLSPNKVINQDIKS